jgi:hypothetical protein
MKRKQTNLWQQIGFTGRIAFLTVAIIAMVMPMIMINQQRQALLDSEAYGGSSRSLEVRQNLNRNLKPTCMPRPACLDATYPCEIAEPLTGWCPTQPTLRPSLTVTRPIEPICDIACLDGYEVTSRCTCELIALD